MCKDRIGFPKLMLIAITFVVCYLVTYPNSIIPSSAATEKSGSKSTSAAKTTGNKLKTPIIDPKADQLLREMGDLLKTAKHVYFTVEIMFDDLLPSDQKLQFAAYEEISVEKPNRIFAEYLSDLGAKRFWYDGKTVTLLDGGTNNYTSFKAAPTLDKTLNDLMKEYGFSPPLSDFVYGDPYAVLIENVEAGIYVGLGDVNGARCHHLAFVEKYIDWQIWIEDGKQKLPRKLVITYKTMPRSPQYIAVLSDWNFTKSLPASLFRAELPAKAVRVEFLSVTKKKN
ncbi:MAG: DUF2092 domain-containing protein [Thermodesulfobacteriota bacterium]